MKQILIPISFSDASANSLRKSVSLYEKCELTLLHCFSPYDYNRQFNFGKKSYEEGIKEMLLEFFEKHSPKTSQNIKLIAIAGSVSETIAEISNKYDLLVMSKRKLKEKGGFWFSDRVTYIASKGHCPVLLIPMSPAGFRFGNFKNIWHLNRKENESDILKNNLPTLDIDPGLIKVKFLEQTSFKSSFWKAILTSSKTKDSEFLKEFSNAHEYEKVDLIILVSHRKDSFQNFMKAEVVQVINQFDIPLLVLQA